MSRALDKDVKEALKNGDHQRVFAEISSVLIQPTDEPLEIELLPASHVLEDAVCMQDGRFIAIPKLRLVQAFLVARKILLAYLDAERRSSTDDNVWRATAVMLLMDPEHLTAANTRKRLLCKVLASKQHGIEESLTRERIWVDSLLTSRLHRHTKSPNLWSHRRWLAQQSKEAGISIDVVADLRRVIMVSGERHPRNYYAWCHARYLANTIIPTTSMGSHPDDTIAALVTETRTWAFAHHDDISGWQFLMFLLGKLPEETGPTIRQALQLSESFKWRNESVWYFLRYAMPLLPPAAHETRKDYQRVGKMLGMSFDGGQ